MLDCSCLQPECLQAEGLVLLVLSPRKVGRCCRAVVSLGIVFPAGLSSRQHDIGAIIAALGLP